jgi:hypothetical protein
MSLVYTSKIIPAVVYILFPNNLNSRQLFRIEVKKRNRNIIVMFSDTELYTGAERVHKHFFSLWRYSPISGLGLILETFSLQLLNLGQSVGLLG